jgi:hypothetical protein
MAYVIDWPPKRLLALAAVGVALLLTAPAASADTSTCPIPPSSPMFSQFGDSSSYALVPGGTFEGDMSGWTLSGASLAQGNEPWQVNGAGDSQSLSIPSNGSAVSPSFCVTNQFPSWRFFARLGGGASWSSLSVSVQWTDQNGNSGVRPVITLKGGEFRSWAPTGSLVLGPVLDSATTMTERLVFANSGGAGWQIDDLYIDPYAKR